MFIFPTFGNFAVAVVGGSGTYRPRKDLLNWRLF